MQSLLPIEKVAQKIGLAKDDLEFYGKYKAKILGQPSNKVKNNNLILVTAMTPGKFGEGKTTVSIGLSQALWQLNTPNIVVLREPSLGPCFGMKGGATGGGLATIEPQDDINYHFTGDIHAVTYAHNLLSSLIDNSLYFDNPFDIDINSIFWPRVLDLNDRALREITTRMAKKDGSEIVQKTRFDISVTSEVMAILCLSKDLNDLKERLGKIIIGFDKNGRPVTAKMLKADGAMTVLLKDALKPNLVQTSEGTPAVVHGGPFANIAHGTASLLAIKTAQQLAPYTIVEAGFGADLGAEKFLDIVCRLGALQPKAAVLIVTTRAVEESGIENVKKHVENLQNFGLNVIICLNRFTDDNFKTIKLINQFASANNLPIAETFVFQKGGKGGIDLAKLVLEACQKETVIARNRVTKQSQKNDEIATLPSVARNDDGTGLNFVYNLSDSPQEKILKLCQKIYGAKDVDYTSEAKSQLDKFGKLAKSFYICMAKTQYSLSDNPDIKGAPENYTFRVREVRLAAGAQFLIPVAGEIMTMPGLPRHPLAETINI
ncbi:MAG: formate--tetrahydrofolate ligase [Candidatus Gottesmanbacteria bacterium]